MRTPLLLVLALAAVALGVVALRMGETPEDRDLGLSSPRIEATASPPRRASATTLVTPAATPADPVPQPASAESRAGYGAPRALEGVVRDRFGSPVRERVLLLAEGQVHPGEGADLTQFVTAVSSREGRFSLSLPHAGPWRLGVGAPGAPRLAPTEERELDGSQRADVVVSGTAALSVVFEEPPPDSRVTIEVVTLRENADGGRGSGRRSGDRGTGLRDSGRVRRGGRGGAERGTSLRDAGGRGSPRERGGDNESGNRDDRRGASVPRAAGAPPAWASLTRRIGQDLDLQSSGGGQRQDRRPRSETPAETEEEPAGPPPEVWRSQDRRTVEGAELFEGAVEFTALPAGPVARLALSVGDERYEGVARFTLAADARVEVRVLPWVPGSGALTYLTSTRPLAPDESPAGVTWSE